MLRECRSFVGNAFACMEQMGMYDYLEGGYDHKMTLTTEFLTNNGIVDVEPVIQWLRANGGCGDCEVLANVEEKFGPV